MVKCVCTGGRKVPNIETDHRAMIDADLNRRIAGDDVPANDIADREFLNKNAIRVPSNRILLQ